MEPFRLSSLRTSPLSWICDAIIYSLGFDLFGAVAIRLAQRYAKSWSIELMAQIKSTPNSLNNSGVSTLARAPSHSDVGAEKLGKKKSYSKGILAYLKSILEPWLIRCQSQGIEPRPTGMWAERVARVHEGSEIFPAVSLHCSRLAASGFPTL
jgi:hypothetical protein